MPVFACFFGTLLPSSRGVIAWALCFLLGGAGVALLVRELELSSALFGLSSDQAGLARVANLLRELEETLSSGLAPSEERWSALRALPAPWGALSSESVQELRSSGGAIVPTLRRLRALALDHRATIGRARAKASQAVGQAIACLLLVPVFGGALYLLLPGLDHHCVAWVMACAVAALGAIGGAAWMLAMASRARWGGLQGAARDSILAAYCGGERFLALLRAGTPADLAWSRTIVLLERDAPALAREWGHSVWGEPLGGEPIRGRPPGLAVLASAGEGLRKAVQVSLLDGRPCAERVETALMTLRKEWDSLVERELGLLATRTLKPLFLCVAPSLLGLLFFAIGEVWMDYAGGGLTGAVLGA